MADGSTSTLTNPVTGTGTTNYLPKFTGASTIGNSLVYDNGTSVVIGTATPATNYILTLRTQSADYTKVLDWGTAAGGSWGNMTINISAPYQTILNSGAWQFNTSGTQKMLLDSSGNLGLGVTPSAWNDGFVGFEIKNKANNLSANGGSYFEISQNATWNSGWKYVNTARASRYEQGLGEHFWYNAPSGTAGNAITFTQAMTLFANGNLAVGTTTDAGQKLQVSGMTNSGISYRAGTYTQGDTTPSVSGVSYLGISNSSATTITNFTNGIQYQIITLYFSDSNTTINRSNCYLSGGVNFTSTAADILTLINIGGFWYEVSRSVNS
jgi:hypothetical protein